MSSSEIDRLIEEGLTLYGQGDLDGALLQWERALAIDPENAQATSYVDYVRANYDLLTADVAGTQESAPFGIADDEPEYQIEIQPGEIKPSMPSISMSMKLDAVDEGWTIEETVDTSAYPGRTRSRNELTLEADEPPPPEGVSFDDATREYNKRDQLRAAANPTGGFEPQPTPAPANEFADNGTPAFGHPHDFQTPPGFGSQATGVKARDRGFVIPTGTQTMTGLGLPNPKPAAPAATAEDAPTSPNAPISAESLGDLDLDLIGSLPTPRPAPSVPQVEIETPLSGAKRPNANTRDLPQQTRAPAFSTTGPTRDMHEAPAVGAAQTVDFDSKTTERPKHLDETREIPSMGAAAIVGAPTRDLGLRDAAVANTPKPSPKEKEASKDATRADVMLPFDPIDARAAEILDDADEGAPHGEAREDKTRRRITTLFEKAAQWSGEGDLERAVAAVDLALSEDPNSALAQKLIHRNRDTIMSVFQAYLGNLDRTPQLARPLQELAHAPISPRAAFLLSRIDGLLTIDEILDVCGMPRLEAYRYLCQLFLRNVLR